MTYDVIFYARIVKVDFMCFILIAHFFLFYSFLNEYRVDKKSMSHLFLIPAFTHMRWSNVSRVQEQMEALQRQNVTVMLVAISEHSEFTTIYNVVWDPIYVFYINGLPWLPGPSLSSRMSTPRQFQDCVIGLRTSTRECTPLMVSLRRWRRRWTGCIFFQHSRQGRPPKPKREGGPLPQRRRPKGRGMVALPGKSRISRAASRSWREPCRNGRLGSLTRRGKESPRLLQMGEVGYYRRNCTRNSGVKTGNKGRREPPSAE